MFDELIAHSRKHILIVRIAHILLLLCVTLVAATVLYLYNDYMQDRRHTQKLLNCENKAKSLAISADVFISGNHRPPTEREMLTLSKDASASHYYSKRSGYVVLVRNQEYSYLIIRENDTIYTTFQDTKDPSWVLLIDKVENGQYVHVLRD